MDTPTKDDADDYGNTDNDDKHDDDDDNGAIPSEGAGPFLAIGSPVPWVVQAELALFAVVTVAVVQAPIAEISATSRHFETFTQKSEL